MQAAVMQAAQIEATYQAGGALARAYMNLRSEMLLILQPQELADLRAEFDRLFPVVDAPPPYTPVLPETTAAGLSEAMTSARVGLAQLQGWIQGLIDELTLEKRLQLEAEAKAKRAPTGFTPP